MKTRGFKKIFRSAQTIVIAIAVVATSVLPQLTIAQTPSNEPIPPRPTVEIPTNSNPIEDIHEIDNVGVDLIQGGRDAIDECVNQPLGEFSGILSSNLTAMAAEFLGGAGIVNKAGEISATAVNIANAALGVAKIASKLAPLLGLPGVGEFLGGAQDVQDSRTFQAIQQSAIEMVKLNSKVASIQARGTGNIIEILQGMQVSDSCIDRVVFIQAQQMLHDLKDKAVEWIQSGFEDGGPGFIQDLEQRRRDLAASEWLAFLDPDSAQFQEVCSTFRYDVVFNVRQAYNRSFGGDPTQVVPEVDLSVTEEYLLQNAVTSDIGDDCALNQITGSEENTRRFLGGEFISGGWDGWLAFFHDPGSNPNSASNYYFNELTDEINEGWEAQRDELMWSGGYLSDKVCADGSPVGYAEICPDGSEPIIVTPGQTVATIVDEMIASDIRRYELADEIGEIVESLAMTLIGQLFPTGGRSQAPGLARLSRPSFEEAFTEASNRFQNFGGTNPESFSIAMLDRQTSTEERLYEIFSNIWHLRNSPGFEDAEQCIEGNADLQATMAELDALIESIIPGSEEARKASQDYEPPGRYKVDWAGNDLDWEYERVYGLQSCERDQYGDFETERDTIPDNFVDSPQFSFRVPTDSDNWVISICTPTDDGGPTIFVPLDYNPPAYRKAQNLQKVDWNGLPFDWKYYDPFTKENAYLINECSTQTEGEFAYSVGRSLANGYSNRIPNINAAYQGIWKEPGDYHRGSWCGYIMDVLGFGKHENDGGCGRSKPNNNSPSSYSDLKIAMSRALNWLLGASLPNNDDEPIIEISESTRWYKNKCAIEGYGGKVEGDKLYRAYSDYYIDVGPIGPAYSDQPRATSLDVLLANISVTLDGLPDLVAPQSVINEVLDQIENRDLVQEGLYDLQTRLDEGEAMSIVAQAFYNLADERPFHDNEDVNLARDGYRRILDLYELVLQQSEGCQTTEGGGMGGILLNGNIRVNNTNPANNQIDLPADYEQPISISWDTEYCDGTVYVYKDGELFATGENGEEIDDTLIGQDTTAVYQLYCDDPGEIIINPPGGGNTGGGGDNNPLPGENDPRAVGKWLRQLAGIKEARAQGLPENAFLLDYIIVDAKTSMGSNTPVGEIRDATGVLTINGRNQNFSVQSDAATMNISWITDSCPTNLHVYRDNEVLYSGAEDNSYVDSLVGTQGTATYTLYCGQRPAGGETEETTSGIGFGRLLGAPSTNPVYKRLDIVSVTVISSNIDGGEGEGPDGDPDSDPDGEGDPDGDPDSDPDGDDNPDGEGGPGPDCQFETVYWNEGINSCSGTASSGDIGSNIIVGDLLGNGSASFDCTDSGWELNPDLRSCSENNGFDPDNWPEFDFEGAFNNFDMGGFLNGIFAAWGFDGRDNDFDGCIDDSSSDPDGSCNNGGLYDTPEPNWDQNGDGVIDDEDGIDNDGDGCIDDSYDDPDGSCDDGGDYTHGEDEIGTGTSSTGNTSSTTGNGIDDDGDGSIDDSQYDPDGHLNNGGAYDSPEDNPNDGIDNDGDGCIDDSYDDPDGSCNDGGDYTRGEEMANSAAANGIDDDGDGVIDDVEGDGDGRLNNGGAYDRPEPSTDENGDGIPDDQDGIDNDGDGCIDDSYEDPDGSCDDGGDYTRGEDQIDNDSLPITDISDLGDTGQDDQKTSWWWLLWIIIILLIAGILFFIYKKLKARRERKAVAAANQARLNQIPDLNPPPTTNN